MLFKEHGKFIKCEKCGYVCYEPIPDVCPNCGNEFPKEKEVAASFYQEKGKTEVSEFKITSQRPSEKVSGIKVKKKSVVEKIDFDSEIINIKGTEEYIKMIGIVTLNRTPIFCFNEKLSYFIELTSNLQYIASSILHGELDRMTFQSVSADFIPGDTENIKHFDHQEKMTYGNDERCLYMVFGTLPDKKAYWIITQLKKHLKDIASYNNLDEIDDISLYNLKSEMKKRIHMTLTEVIKLQTTFTDAPIQSTSDYMRIDYVGLSYQSVGVLSKVITDQIKIDDMVIHNTDGNAGQSNDLKESLISAKLEAIAANTVANTRLMPFWISVKKGFDQYGFIIFTEINNYFIQILSEGNPLRIIDLTQWLIEIAAPYTNEPFKGNVGKFRNLMKEITELIK